MRFLAAALILAAAPAAAAGEAQMDFVEFFVGKTVGENEVKIAFRKPVRQVTESIGRRAANGDLILQDTIREEGKPVKKRRWVMRASGPNRFTGTMSDAVTPVQVRINGRTAKLSYNVKGGISVDQELTLRDSRTVTNLVSARKLGIRLGRLEGIIRKVD